jgi:hypothetical protein
MILEFPKKDETKALELQLLNKMEELDTIYDKLEMAHTLLNTLEQVANEAEQEFDTRLTEYANIVGPGTLEADMLLYSRNAVAVHNEGNWHLEWRAVSTEDEEL